MYNYNSDYSYGYRGYSHSAETDAIAGMSIAFFLIFALIAAVVGYVISSLLYMLIFKKAGIDAKKLGFLSITAGYSSNLVVKKAGNLF